MMLPTYGQPLVMRQRPMPVPGPGEIRLRISASGIGAQFLWLVPEKRKYRPTRSLTPIGRWQTCARDA